MKHATEFLIAYIKRTSLSELGAYNYACGAKIRDEEFFATPKKPM